MFDALSAWLGQLNFSFLFETILIVLASLLCITVHEFSHGLAAYWLGDRTAKRQGRLTLNPFRHIDLIGLLMMSVARFGWAKPVPVNMRNFRNPKIGMAITAAAGPLSNALFALLALLMRSILIVCCMSLEAIWMQAVYDFLAYLVILNCGLAVFNILPIPPLDGSKILAVVLPDRLHIWLMRFERYGMALLAALLLFHVLDQPLYFLRNGLLNIMEQLISPLITLLMNCMR